MSSSSSKRRRMRSGLRRALRDMLRGDPPTVDLLHPVEPDVPSDGHVLQVLELCMQVGEVLLSGGEPVDNVSTTMTRLAAACGLHSVDVDITFTSITMYCHRGRSVAPLSSMYLVSYRTTDLTRLAEVTRIVDRVVRGRMDVPAFDAALTRAVTAPHPYPRWVATSGWAGLAAAATFYLGGSLRIAIAALVITAAIDRLGRVLGRWGAPAFFLQLAGGLLATLGTLGLFAAGVLPAGTESSLVIAANITVLLSGLSVMSTVQDAISGYPVTAAGRGTELVLLSAGLLTGVTLGLKLGLVAGLTLDPASPVVADTTQFGISTAAAAAAAAMFAIASYAPLRSLPAAAVAGGIASAVYGALTSFLNAGPVVATGLAAVAIGVLGEVLRRRTRIHQQVIVLSGTIPLLPGLTAYRGFYQLASVRDVVDGLVTIMLALAIALALAGGVTLGQLVAGRLASISRRPARRSG